MGMDEDGVVGPLVGERGEAAVVAMVGTGRVALVQVLLCARCTDALPPGGRAEYPRSMHLAVGGYAAR
jgi:hypothetical protein